MSRLLEVQSALQTALAKLPRHSLGSWPTPLLPMKGIPGAFVKREDLCSTLYGGNKIRKLEFLLADPACQKAKTLISMGAVGSHHLEALSILKQKDQELIGLLFPQPVTPSVWHTLGVLLANGVRLIGVKGEFEMAARALAIQAEETLKGNKPYLITPGGSTPLGVLGWVEGAIETLVQAQDQDLGKVIAHVAPAGSLGTIVGLRIGLALAGEKTRLVAVRVAMEGFVNRPMLESVTAASIAKLWSLGIKPPDLSLVDLELEPGYLGDGYGHSTTKSEDALEKSRDILGLKLDGTYSAKTFACFLDRYGEGLPDGETAIFYQTFNQIPHEGLSEAEVRRQLKNNSALVASLQIPI